MTPHATRPIGRPGGAALPTGFWEGQASSVQELLSDKGFREVWELNSHMFSRAFQGFVGGLSKGDGGSILTRAR